MLKASKKLCNEDEKSIEYTLNNRFRASFFIKITKDREFLNQLLIYFIMILVQ
jgi:hypothetical protein